MKILARRARGTFYSHTQNLRQWLIKKPERAVLALAGAQIFAWVILPYLASSAPPLDVVEALVWGKEWLLGTHKHPPLVPWLAELSFQVTRSPMLGPYLLSQICVGLTYLFVFEIGRRLTAEHNALVGTLLLTSVVYFTWVTPEFNHNVVQLPIWSGAILLFTMAREKPERGLVWIGLGAVAALGLYAKYSVLVLYAILGAWLLWDKGMRRALKTPWPWLGLLVAAGLAAPQLTWLAEHRFAAFDYFVQSSGEDGSLLTSLSWLAAELGMHLPMLLFFGFVGYGAVKALPVEPSSPHLPYVAFLGLAPVLLTALIAIPADVELRDMWGMPMFTLSGLLVVLLLRREWTEALTARAFVTAVGFIVTVAVAYAAAVLLTPLYGAPKRTAWPMQEIAQKAHAAWSAHTKEKLRIVSGDDWLAGLIAVGSPERPSVVYEGELALSPWLDARRLDEEGVLYIWGGTRPPSGLIPEDAEIEAMGTFHVEGTRLPGGVVGYAIRLPRQ